MGTWLFPRFIFEAAAKSSPKLGSGQGLGFGMGLFPGISLENRLSLVPLPLPGLGGRLLTAFWGWWRFEVLPAAGGNAFRDLDQLINPN